MEHTPPEEPTAERGSRSEGAPSRAAHAERASAGGVPPDGGPSPATYVGLGFQFLGAILLFLYLGRWLDQRLGTTPWLLIVGVFVGAGAGFYSLYRKLMR